MQISELKLAKDLIRKPSVTPKDAGAINLLAKNLKSIGFKCKLINFKNVKNLYAKLGKNSPNFCYAGHTDVVPPGNIKQWTVNPFKPAVKGKYFRFLDSVGISPLGVFQTSLSDLRCTEKSHNLHMRG